MSGSLRARARVVTTVLVTVLVVCSEFLLLRWVYHLDDDVVAQRVAHAQVAGALRQWSPGEDPAAVRDAVDRAVATDAPGSTRLALATRDWSATTPASDAAEARAAARAMGESVVDAQAGRDRLAAEILIGLLVGVSIGWFVWFRRLVARHRELQARLTEREVVDAGERRLLALVRSSADVVAVLEPDSTVTFVSPAVESVLGLDPDQLTGRRLVDRVVLDDRLRFSQLLAGGEASDQPVMLRVNDAWDRTLVLEGTLNDLTGDPAVRGLVLTVRDVTERQRLQDDLAHQAFHDTLTGLPNRQLFADRVDQTLRRLDKGSARSACVLFLDLDDFKLVNDSHGHGTGDQLLREAAERLRACVGRSGTTARLGGDEFAILVEDVDAREATALAEDVLACLRPALDLDGHRHVLAASVGIAEAVSGGLTAEELMRDADLAMYMAKDRGKGRVAVYESAWHQRAMAVLDLRNDLRWAIDADELVLHFQPTVDLATQQISGFEALVRWNHPERGLVPPSEFIPVAEQSGLIVPLGRWVLRHASRAAAAMRTTGRPPSLAVNVATQQLATGTFVDDVLEALAASGLPAERLVLEITETALLEDVSTSVEALSALRAHGVRVAIDDFGTGYSSLSQLSRLPIDVLKVDKSFVDDLLDDGDGALLVGAILAMSDSLRLQTVAEGVEEHAQAQWLQASRCTTGQGFWWSRPLPLEDALELLETGVPQLLPSAATGSAGPGPGAGAAGAGAAVVSPFPA